MDKYRSKYKKKRRGFHGYKPEKITTTDTQSESMLMQDGEELSLSSVGKTERICLFFKDFLFLKMTCARRGKGIHPPPGTLRNNYNIYYKKIKMLIKTHNHKKQTNKVKLKNRPI